MIYDKSAYSDANNIIWELRKKAVYYPDIVALNLLSYALNQQFMRETPGEKPLQKNDLEKMDFQRVWLAYPSEDAEEIADVEDCGEWALVYHGQIYSISSLEGAGFENLLLDCMMGEDMNQPSGKYQVFRQPHFYIGGKTDDEAVSSDG